VPGGKPIRRPTAVHLRLRTFNSLVAFYDIHGKKGRCYSFVPNTTRDKYNSIVYHIIVEFIIRLANVPASHECNANILLSLLYYACYMHINLPLESLYLLKYCIKFRRVILKIEAYIRTDSGKGLYFILCYDYEVRESKLYL
jgi:hypothetical protein